ncbi:lysozyme inhibitor LprI family protein [Variovorax sp. UC122_21]|uniref:lysozyme inhibitor LprI family protein n=1 Tax=Variovorax sp. UC122_21 TaxID=3374554 RepID=UPI003756D36D
MPASIRNLISRALALGLAALACVPAHAASFDCAKASNPTEKTICATPALSLQDESMADLYRKRLATADAGQWATYLKRDQCAPVAVRAGVTARATRAPRPITSCRRRYRRGFPCGRRRCLPSPAP